MDDILAGLNKRQKEAASHQDGPLLIIAGAGSGKTRVLTKRIAYLLSKGVNPYEILAITFTNKAAKEMKERIGSETSEFTSKALFVSTFHSMCNRFLRSDIEPLGYTTNFNIYDSSDQESLMKKVMKEHNIDDKKFTPRGILGAISSAKNKLEDYVTFQKKAGDYYEEVVGAIYESYQKALKQANSLDFDDLLYLTVKLFKGHPDVLKRYQERFKYISVDEYQDTNYVQFLLIKMLSEKHKNICVVGDPDQSIYGWRGADMQNILDFEKDYPNAKTIYLEQNYRSSSNILEAANEVIKNNEGRKPKDLWTENKGGDKIVCFDSVDENEEAVFIAREIEYGIRDGRHYKDYAIFFRTNSQSRVIEKSLARYGIPYRLYGGLSFFKRKEIKDLLSYLQYLNNPKDRVSLERIINIPKRGIGGVTVAKIISYGQINDLTLEESLKDAGAYLAGNTLKKVEDFYQMIDKLKKMVESSTLTELTEAIIKESGYIKALEAEKTVEANERIQNVKELISETKEFDLHDEEKTLESFLANTALYSELDDLNGDDKVTLITLHMAKGLEYKVVFITGMEEGIFPHYRSQGNPSELEEERRLCYVGITRGEEKVYLTRAYQRSLYGITRSNEKSRFFEEIPNNLKVAYGQEVSVSSKDYEREKPSLQKGGFALGDKVSHSKFGEGIIVRQEGLEQDSMITIAFPGIGLKKLMAQYAPIKKIK